LFSDSAGFYTTIARLCTEPRNAITDNEAKIGSIVPYQSVIPTKKIDGNYIIAAIDNIFEW